MFLDALASRFFTHSKRLYALPYIDYALANDQHDGRRFDDAEKRHKRHGRLPFPIRCPLFKSEVMFSIKALEAKSKVYLYGVFVDMKENLSVSPFSFVIISFLSLSSIPAKFCTAC